MAVEVAQVHSVNPATEERIGTYALHSDRDVDAVLDAAVARFPGWRATSLEDRCAVVAGSGAPPRAPRHPRRVDHRRDGQDARGGACRGGEVRVHVQHWFAAHAPASSPTSPSRATVRAASWPSSRSVPCSRACHGTSRFGRCSASPRRPVAGNCAVLKHASNVSGCALAIGQLFTDAGMPARRLRRDPHPQRPRRGGHRGPTHRGSHPDRERRRGRGAWRRRRRR